MTPGATWLRSREALIGRPTDRLDLGVPLLRASASPLDFHHPDPELTALRRRVPVTHGDYTLTIYQHPHAAGLDFLDFVAACVHEQRCATAHSPITAAALDELWGEDAYPSPMMEEVRFPSPAHVLWQICSFGVLGWNPAQLRWLHEAITRAEAGEPVGQRPTNRGSATWVATTPELRAAEVPDVWAEALGRLDAWARRERPPAALLAAMTEAIDADCQTLADLCARSGSFGRLVFPDLGDPCARATQMLVGLLDGNTREVFLETEDAWVGLLFETS